MIPHSCRSVLSCSPKGHDWNIQYEQIFFSLDMLGRMMGWEILHFSFLRPLRYFEEDRKTTIIDTSPTNFKRSWRQVSNDGEPLGYVQYTSLWCMQIGVIVYLRKWKIIYERSEMSRFLFMSIKYQSRGRYLEEAFVERDRSKVVRRFIFACCCIGREIWGCGESE